MRNYGYIPLCKMRKSLDSNVEQVRLVDVSRIPRNVVAEFTFEASRDYDDPWSELEVDVEFTNPDGAVFTVPAFWSGGRTWRVRYSSPLEGAHSYLCCVRGDDLSGLDGLSGSFRVVGYEGSNPLLVHGPVRVSDNRRHLVHADGKPFFWLADTWWHGMSERFSWPATVQRLADDRASKGFSVVQIVAGLMPDCESFGSDMASEGGQPLLDGGRGQVNPQYYSVPDVKIDYLVARGLMPCIVGGWGYFVDLIGMTRMKQHWRYLVARYAAYPVVWCIAGEVDLVGTRSVRREESGSYDPGAARRKGLSEWEEISRYVTELDPFCRVRTVHPAPGRGDWSFASSEAFASRESFDLDMMQTGHTGRACVPQTMEHLHRALQYGDKPVINGECAYEGFYDSNWQDLQRFVFWSHILSGTAGHSYGTMAIAVLNSRGDPRECPYGVHFWEDAINWLGANQMGIGKRVLEELSWWELRPAAELIKPYAGLGDWFLPYAATNDKGRFVVYIPADGMAPDVTTLVNRRLTDIVILTPPESGLHRGLWVDPRSGGRSAIFDLEAVNGECRIPPRPSREDWVLVLDPAE